MCQENRIPLLELDDAELRAQATSENNRAQLFTLFMELLNELRYEIERLERYLDQLSSQNGILAIVAGLVSILSFSEIKENQFLRYYLIAIFPYLAIGVTCYLISLPLKRARVSTFLVSTDPVEKIMILRSRARAYHDIWIQLNAMFEKKSKLLNITHIALVLFLISFVINFYLFIFLQSFTFRETVLFNVALILFGYLMLLSFKRKSYEKRF